MSAIAFWDEVASPAPAGASTGFFGKGLTLPGTAVGTDATGKVISISPEGALYAPNVWDQVWLNWQQLPGKCSAKGLPMLAIDKKKAGGVDGATITVQGYLPGPIEIESLIWTPQQWTKWQEIIDFIWRKPTQRKSKVSELAVQISAPGLDWLGIKLAVVLGMTPPEDGPIRGSKVIKIKSLEYVNLERYIKTAKPAPKNVPLDTHLVDTKNGVRKPSAGDGGPTGPRRDRRGGAV